MSKHEENEETNPEKIITYVYIPDEDIYGIIVREGAYASVVQYFERGIGYLIEISNDEYIVVDEIGIGHLDEMEENL
jgi:hypothetical protein